MPFVPAICHGLSSGHMQCTSGDPYSGLWPVGLTAYTEDLTAVSKKHCVHSHMYADDTQLYDSSTLVDAESVRDRLTSCISEVAKWCVSRRLQLNAEKTEMIWFGSRSSLTKLQRINRSLQVGTNNYIQPSSVVRDLGVYTWTRSSQ